MNDPNDSTTIADLASDLQEAMPGTSVDIPSAAIGLENTKIEKIINSVFYSVIGITMFLCFFSLCASMSSNIYDQRKEVAILRAMGLTRIRIKLLYFYESMLLVLASCTLGVFIGVLVGYTMIF